MAYIICFIFTTLFAYLSQKQFDKDNKKIGILYAFLTIFIPSFIAGIRSLDVGRDVNIYITPTIKAATSNSFMTYLGMTTELFDIEIGYKILVYLITRISTSPNFLLFILQFLTVSFIYLFAYKSRGKSSITFIIIIYLLLWYCLI